MKGTILKDNHDEKYLDLLRKGDLKQGFGIGCDLDNHLRFKLGTFNVILGHSNTGKTYWVLWYCLTLAIQQEIRFLVFSSENNVWGLKRNLIQLFAGEKVEGMDEKKFYQAKTFVDTMFKFVDTDHLYSYKDLIKTFDANLDLFDVCLIDPYNSLVREKGMNAHEMDYQIASEFRIFCRKNLKTMYVIAHASTEALRKVYPKDEEDGKAGMPIAPNSADIEGGGKWVNRADDFVVIHRLTQHESLWMNTEVHVKKVKETETGGAPTFIKEPVIFRLKQGCKFLCKSQGRFIDLYNQREESIEDLPEIKPNIEFDNDVPF